MDKHKAIGVDNVHVELLQIEPVLFARILSKVWETIGNKMSVPRSWTMGILVPLQKSGLGNNPENYQPLCMLSNIRKVIEKSVTAKLEQVISTDRMKFGFQRNISTLHSALDIAEMIE